MNKIDSVYGKKLATHSIFSSTGYFYVLFAFMYDLMYGIKSKLDESKKPKRVPKSIYESMINVENRVREYSDKVMEIFDTRRATIKENRERMLKFIKGYL